MFSSSKEIERALYHLEIFSNKMTRHLSTLGLSVSPSKSSLIIFTKQHINPFAYSIKINNSEITSTDSCKFLGINLDYRLSGKSHLIELSKRCSKLLNIISMLRGT